MYIQNDNLTIRNAVASDAAQLGKWWRDGEVMTHAGFPKGLTITDDEIISDISTFTDNTRRVLIIEADSTPIGEMSYSIMGDATAEIGIKICDTTMQGKGYGTALLRMFISSLFYEYGCDKIILDTNLNNIRAQHTYEKIGFRRIGQRIDCWKDQLGVLQSAVDYELYKNEWKCTI